MLCTVHGAPARSIVIGMSPALVLRSSVTVPVFGVAAGSGGSDTFLPVGAGDEGVVVYLHGPFDVTGGVVGVVGGELDEPAAAVPLPCRVVTKKMPATTTTTAMTVMMTAFSLRRLARTTRLDNWRSSFRFAAWRRCSLVGTCSLPGVSSDGVTAGSLWG